MPWSYLSLRRCCLTFVMSYLKRSCLTLVGAVGGETVRLLERAEVDALTGQTLAVQADGLHLDYVVRLLLQVPENAGPTGGVHLPDEALGVAVLPLCARGDGRMGGEERREERDEKEEGMEGTQEHSE